MTTLESAPAAGLTNLRDIGGLPTEDGRTTRHGVLYRSDVPLAGDEAPTGLVWPPRTVVDLRSSDEQHRAPTPFPGVELHRLPLLDSADPAKLGRPGEGGIDAFMTRLYLEIITSSGAMVATLPALAARADAPLLIHCTAGRDRTGVSVAVLLRVAGVTREAVMGDYVATSLNQPRLFPRLAAHGFFPKESSTGRAVDNWGDTAVAMESVLDTLDAHEGGTYGWLLANGSDETAIAAWRERILG